jgi:hypothetical protein
MIGTILLLFAFGYFVIGTFAGHDPTTGPWVKRCNFISAGLAAWSLAVLLGKLLR